MKDLQVATLTQVARFLESALCCLMGAGAAPAPFVGLYPVSQLLLSKLDDVRTLTQVVSIVIAVSTVGLLLSLVRGVS